MSNLATSILGSRNIQITPNSQLDEPQKLSPGDIDLLAGVIYAASVPDDPEDSNKVGSVIYNRTKELGKTPMEIISKDFTEVGKDSDAKYRPFLQGDFSGGGKEAAARSYQIAKQILQGTFQSNYDFNTFSGDGKKNSYSKVQLSKNAWDNPNNILYKRYATYKVDPALRRQLLGMPSIEEIKSQEIK